MAMSRLLDRLTASRANYWLGLGLDTGVSIALVAAGVTAAVRSADRTAPAVVEALAAFLLGILNLSFTEYAVHRWLYHGRPSALRRIHAHHHGDATLLIGAPFFTSVALCALIACLARCAVSTPLAAVFAGATLMAFAYHGAVHHLFHHHRLRGRGYFARRRRAHLVHHHRGDVNFGVTSPLWDHLLGTSFDRARRRRAA
jgi:sterol desaturase/sphingolipid hydroxylase (fatty acid hydroxylase superfamily)